MRFSGMIRIRICDPRSLESWHIKGTAESTLDKASAVPLIRNDPSDIGSLILIRIKNDPSERTLRWSLTGNIHKRIFQNCDLKSGRDRLRN